MHAKIECKGKGGFLAEIDRFDHSFFRLSPKEAASLDPQQRISLEVAYEALLDGACHCSNILS